MSERVGVIAVYGLDAYELADLFPSVPEGRFASSNDWAWLRFALDEPIATDLTPEAVRDRVGTLKKLALDIRAEPDDHWRLSLYPARGTPLHLAFHHSLYRPLTLPRDPDHEVPVMEVLARRDAALPEDFRAPEDVLAKVADKPRAKGHAVFKKVQANRVATLIDKQKVSGFGEDLRPALLGENCNVDELLAPLGILPKVLDALALGKALDGDETTWRVGPLAESQGSFDREACLFELAPEVRPIAGGPVELPATDLALFWLWPWFCETDAEVDILVTPPGAARVPLPRTEYWATVHRRRGRAYVEVAWNPPGPRFKVYRSLGEALAAAPEGTVVEFLSSNMSEVDPDEDTTYKTLPGGSQRYRGTLTGRGTYLLTDASVPVTHSDVQAAMEICRKIADPKPTFEMADEAEANAVVERGRGTAWFAGEDELPRVKGMTVVPAGKGAVMTTAMMVFRQRFAAGPWDTGGAQQRDEKSNQEWDTMIEEVGKTVSAVLAAPTGDDVVLRTERAVFRKVDWTKMNVGVLDAIAFLWGRAIGENEPPPQTPAEKLEPVDRILSDLGFAPLGDVQCDRFGELYLRGYAGPAGDTYGCVIAGTSGQFHFEFVTRFSNGGSLTTSTTPGLEDQRKRRIFKRSYPTLEPRSLYEKHRSGIKELTAQKAEPVPIDASLEGFCRAIDEYIKNEL